MLILLVNPVHHTLKSAWQKKGFGDLKSGAVFLDGSHVLHNIPLLLLWSDVGSRGAVQRLFFFAHESC